MVVTHKARRGRDSKLHLGRFCLDIQETFSVARQCNSGICHQSEDVLSVHCWRFLDYGSADLLLIIVLSLVGGWRLD